MFLSKMRSNDAFGLVVFNNQAKTLIPLQRVAAINIEAVSAKLKEVHAGGGTTLITGFQESLNEMKSYLSSQTSEQAKKVYS